MNESLLRSKEFEVDIVQIQESNDTVRTMLTADASMPHSTRPLQAATAVVFEA